MRNFMNKIALVYLLTLGLNTYAQSITKIGYESPRAAYLALSKDPSATLQRDAEGWQVVYVSEGAHAGIWTFAPPKHPTFPSVVKREVIEHEGHLFIGMDVICGGTKTACDKYVAEFVKLNQQIMEELNEKKVSEKLDK